MSKKKEDSLYIKDSKDAIMMERVSGAQLVLFLICVFLILAIVWCHFIKIDEITVAHGKIIPLAKEKSIQSYDGGIIKDIFVEDGMHVKKGDKLIKLNEVDISTEYKQHLINYHTLLLENYRLSAQMKKEKSIILPEQLTQQYPDISQQEKSLFETNMYLHESHVKNIKQSIKILEDELSIFIPLSQKKLISKVKLLRTQKNINDLKGQLNKLENEFVQDSMEQFTINKKKISSVKEKIIALKQKFHRTTIRSPINGVIHDLTVSTIGGVIKPGETIMKIVPDSKNIIIEASVEPKDIGFIKPGQQAILKFSAYDYSIYGGMKAKIIHISPNTITNQDGKSYFIVKLKTIDRTFSKSNKALSLIPGMSCEVDMITGSKSVLSYLLKPLVRTKDNAFREQ